MIGGIMQGAAALGKLGMSIYQMAEAKRLERENGNMPQMEIPSEVKNMLTTAQFNAAERMPAAQRDEYIKNITRGQENTLKGISSRKGGLTGLAEAQSKSNDAYGSLMAEEARQGKENKMNLQNVQGMYGGYQQQQWEQNKLYPWMQKDALRQSYADAAFKGGANILESAGNMGAAMGNGGVNADGTTPTTTTPIMPTGGQTGYQPAPWQFGANNTIGGGTTPNFWH